jgi:crotonobetainyl-CoA:carnitine CoA-transferase CaiB-like acyl-CoA transferase
MGMYGSEGPLSYQTGYAPCFAALGGVSALVGYEGEAPAGMNVRYADSTFGTMAAYAALVALFHCRREGVGQYVDVSAVECMSSMIGDTIMDYTLNGVVRGCDGNRHPEMAPHGVYPCRDGGWLSIAVASDEQWRALAQAMGRPDLVDDPRFRCHADRKQNEEALDPLVAAWSAERDASAAAVELQGRGIAAARSQSSLDMIADPHLWARGFYREVADCEGQTRTTLGPPWKMTGAAEISAAAPRLGQHNGYVFGDILGLSESEQAALAAAGVTR